MDTVALWIAIAIPILLGFAPITMGGTRTNAKELGKLAHRIGLTLPAQRVGRIVRRIRSQENHALWGGTAGVVIAGLWVLLARSGSGGPLVLLGGAAGASIGSVIGLLRAATTMPDEAPRIARSAAVDATDYVAPWVFGLVRAMIAAALVSGTLGLVITLAGHQETVTLVSRVVLPTVAATAAYVTTELLSRVVTDRARRADSELELAWDDVLRAWGLRQVAISSVVVSAMPGVLLMTLDAITPVGGVLWWPAFLATGISIGLAAIALLCIWARPSDRVLRRLWPDADFDDVAPETV